MTSMVPLAPGLNLRELLWILDYSFQTVVLSQCSLLFPLLFLPNRAHIFIKYLDSSKGNLMAFANNWLRNGHMNSFGPMIRDEKLAKDFWGWFPSFQDKVTRKKTLFSSGIIVCSFEAQNCMRLEMKPIFGEGENQENYKESQCG